MPRFSRTLVEGGIYHVYNRCARGEGVFAGEWEPRRFLDLVSEVKARDGFSLLAWSLLSNHFHLAIRMGPVPLSRSMRSIQGRFSQAFNIKRGRTGPVWQSRYRASWVDAEEYLQRLIAYVHLNPVRAGLAEDPAEYQWCGHREMMGRRRSSLLDVDDALLAFGETRRTARRRYIKALEAALAAEGSERELRPPPRFRRDTKLRAREDVAWVDCLGRSTGLERPTVEAEEFLLLCGEILGVEAIDLRSRRRGERLTRARELVATVGLQRWRQGAKALADALGVYPDSVGRQAARGQRRALEDKEFGERLEDLDRRLAIRLEKQP